MRLLPATRRCDKPGAASAVPIQLDNTNFPPEEKLAAYCLCGTPPTKEAFSRQQSTGTNDIYFVYHGLLRLKRSVAPQPFILVFSTPHLMSEIVNNLNSCWMIDDTHGAEPRTLFPPVHSWDCLRTRDCLRTPRSVRISFVVITFSLG